MKQLLAFLGEHAASDDRMVVERPDRMQSDGAAEAAHLRIADREDHTRKPPHHRSTRAHGAGLERYYQHTIK